MVILYSNFEHCFEVAAAALKTARYSDFEFKTSQLLLIWGNSKDFDVSLGVFGCSFPFSRNHVIRCYPPIIAFDGLPLKHG